MQRSRASVHCSLCWTPTYGGGLLTAYPEFRTVLDAMGIQSYSGVSNSTQT